MTDKTPMISPVNLYLDKKGECLVSADTAGATLFSPAGHVIDAAEVKRLKLVEVDGKVVQKEPPAPREKKSSRMSPGKRS